MMLLISLFVFIFGLCFGSFLNAVIYRLENKESLLTRSHCPYCQRSLGAKDLIPVLSFLFLRGKCRYCQKAISPQYPLVELTAAILFVLISYWSLVICHLPFLFTIYYLLITSALMVIFVFDLKHYLIPDEIVYSAIGFILVFNFWLLFNGHLIPQRFLIYLFSGLAAAGFFLLIVLISKGKWMGGGDVKLAFLMGLFLGFPQIVVALFLAFLSGAVIGVSLILLDKKTIKSEMPFGPFLIFATFLAFFWGQLMVNWYFGLFGVI